MTNVPLAPPHIEDDDITAVVDAIKGGWLAHGDMNKQFEQAFSDYIGQPHAVSLNSCTSALDLALEVFDFPAGSEVIIPSFTWVSTGNVVLMNNLVPRFADIEPDTFNMSIESARAQINERTVAIIAVHFAGLPCDLQALKALADDHNLILIEDSAECLGGSWNGVMAGSIGLSCFSFYPTKNITTCEGGMLVFSDSDIEDRIRALSAHGISKSAKDREGVKEAWHRSASIVGKNYRMPNPLAAMGVSQLSKIDSLNARRNEIASSYKQAISALAWCRPQALPDHARHSYQMFTMLVDGRDKKEVINGLNELGVQASSHFDPPLHYQKPFIPYAADADLAVTEMVSANIVTLPMSPKLTDEQVDKVCQALTSL